RPLEPETTRLVAAALGREPEVRVVADLGAGVRVTTPAGQVDATAAAIARQAARAVSAAEFRIREKGAAPGAPATAAGS
ncbi:MAG TPA: hypothetical protein VMB50_06910, partial [Myxococcales bacterium]|nr:hypothetical protein [Myxococcales bacterium]